MDDSHVARQFALVPIGLATLRTGKGVNLARWFDALVHALLVCFQTVEVGKVTPTDLTGDDDTAIVDLHVELVEIGPHELLATYCTSMFVLGLTPMFKSNVFLELWRCGIHLPTLAALV